MPKFNVGITANVIIEVEADTEEEAKALTLAKPVLLYSGEWDIDYCEQVDEDDDKDEDDYEDDDDELSPSK